MADAEVRAQEWLFCPVHEIVVKHGSCDQCEGDRNLILVTPVSSSAQEEVLYLRGELILDRARLAALAETIDEVSFALGAERSGPDVSLQQHAEWVAAVWTAAWAVRREGVSAHPKLFAAMDVLDPLILDRARPQPAAPK